ncbi:MAG: hypothetical protein HY538_01125 [Deltaproteobacteria bacterium]|nr:hypothetical protein [Deltaproteobacteria bacterium]
MARHSVFQRAADAIVLVAFFFTFGCGSEDPFSETPPSNEATPSENESSPLNVTSLDYGVLLVRSAVVSSEEDPSVILQSVEAQAAEELRQSSFLVVLPEGEQGEKVVQSLLGEADLSNPEEIHQNLLDRLHVVKKDLGAEGPRAVLVLSEEGIEGYVNQTEGMEGALALETTEALGGIDLRLLVLCIAAFVLIWLICAVYGLGKECIEELWSIFLFDFFCSYIVDPSEGI